MMAASDVAVFRNKKNVEPFLKAFRSDELARMPAKRSFIVLMKLPLQMPPRKSAQFDVFLSILKGHFHLTSKCKKRDSEVRASIKDPKQVLKVEFQMIKLEQKLITEEAGVAWPWR